MDPDANLNEQREIVRRVFGGLYSGDALEDLRELAERVEALDEWLTAGGFLPTAWLESWKR